MTKWLGWAMTALLALGFVALVGVRVVQAVARRSDAAELTSASGPVSVRTLEVHARDVSGRIELSGALRPANTVEVVPEVPGRVRSVAVEVGDRVAAGAVLARLDATDLQLAVDQGEGALAAAVAAEQVAEREANSAKALAESKSIADNQLAGILARHAAAVGQRAQAQAARDLARERLRDANITSPIGGIVTRRALDVGQTVGPGQPVFQVQDDSAYEVDVGLDEATAYAVTIGQPVTVRLEARDVELPGRVATLSPSLDRQTRKAAATLRLDPTDLQLITGSTVTVSLELEPRSGVITVPESALVKVDGEAVVRVVEEGNLVRNVSVRSGARQGGEIEVVGLTDGAVVVVAGPSNLVDGAVVAPRS